jgi:hypothetical protein
VVCPWFSLALFLFGLLPKLSETSLLTLAHASGLMAEALDCDDSSMHIIPATGHGTYSFQFTVGAEHPPPSTTSPAKSRSTPFASASATPATTSS